MPAMDLDDIAALYAERGHFAYEGEGVTQWQHAWQSARLARLAQAAPALELAAWLHDLGHLMSGLAGTPTLDGVDDRHEEVAARALRPLFGDAVAAPVALHVAAKRYLVATAPGYRERLSADSVRSLALQGGPMSNAECEAFRRLPHAGDALRLRAWDEAAKDAALLPPDPAAAQAELRALMGALMGAMAAARHGEAR
jgi:phosphonate degradation associated HDIG domain protein